MTSFPNNPSNMTNFWDNPHNIVVALFVCYKDNPSFSGGSRGMFEDLNKRFSRTPTCLKYSNRVRGIPQTILVFKQVFLWLLVANIT